MTEPMTEPDGQATDAPTIAVAGSGRLHAALADSLSGRCRAGPVEELEHFAAGCAALITATDTDDPRHHAVVYRLAEVHGLNWLPLWTESGWALIGPATVPRVPGCPSCARRRRSHNRRNAEDYQLLHREHGTALAQDTNVLITPMGARAVAALVIEEIEQLLADPSGGRTRGALLRVSLRNGAVNRHQVLPNPYCAQCAPPAEYVAPLVGLEQPKPEPSEFRLRSLEDQCAELERTYVDAQTGVIASLGSYAQASWPVAVARLQPGWNGDDSRHGYGSSTSFRGATMTALAEALERISGLRPPGFASELHSSWSDLGERALNPCSLGLYPDDWYDQPGFGYVRFDPDRPIGWVRGYSFARSAPILVPSSIVYPGAGTEDSPPFVYECSNGQALGSSFTEAVLHGLLEVIERDAFLMTWYTRRRPTRIDLTTVVDRKIPLTAEMIRQRQGYRVDAFDITGAEGIPAFWINAHDLTASPDKLRILCAAGAHPDPEHALRRALSELGSMVESAHSRFDQYEAEKMLADSELVRAMHDHSTLYGHPEAARRLSFLQPDQPAQPLSQRSRSWPDYHDLRDDLDEMVSRCLRQHLDVIAVDTTTSVQRAGGFTSVKVIVPGALPMTFGHRYRRIHGFSRLDPDNANPFPHPFP